jgi:ribosomal protein L40E
MAAGKMYLSLPILADGESVIRTGMHTEGIFSEHVSWIKVLTNIRVLFYDFETDASDVVALPRVENVLVMNKRTESVSNYSGQSTRYYAKNTAWGRGDGEKDTTTITVGDVAFVSGGVPVVTFVSIGDPEGFASMARLSVKESSTLFRMEIQEPAKLDAGGEKQQAMACRKCGAPNLPGSAFCTKCGASLSGACRSCGAQNLPDAEFCGRWGKRL